ncbi:MAG: hypothetical protein HY909_19000 [Deltaproteobacteria bacterium]|nr:hypothetical protein [Deltaproteobacteria bacterium]
MERVELDPGLRGVVTARRAMVYAAREHPEQPAHVRAGSGVGWFRGRLLVAQDDVNYLALVDPSTGLAHPVPLPPVEGTRVFGEALGNKHHKLDLEALFVWDGVCWALGSGSTPARRTVVRWDGTAPELVQCGELYALLEATEGFAGSELNVEGAAALPRPGGAVLRLFQRGNGAPRGGLSPQSATVDLPLGALLGYFERCRSAPDAPVPEAVQRALAGALAWDLGRARSPTHDREVPWTFTDGCAGRDGAALYLAAAEDSPDTYHDGPCIGAALGVQTPDGRARQGLLFDRGGAALTDKPEGLVLDRHDPAVAWVVLDRDDPDTPSALCRVELRGV